MSLLKEHQLQEKQLRSTLEMTKKFVDKFIKERDEHQVDVRLSMLDDVLAKFYVVRRKIDILLEKYAIVGAEKDSTGETVDLNKAVWEFENLYCEVKAKLLEKCPRKDNPVGAPTLFQTAQTPSAMCRVKLPEIKLPTFEGKIANWITFRDTFRSLIHNNQSLTAIDKFTYLRTSLIGEALQEIGSVELTAANYDVAWNLLEKRFENKKLIMKNHLDAIFAVEPIRKECFEALNHLLSTVDRNLQMIDKLGVKTKDWSILLAHIVYSKLDSTTLRHWEAHHGSKEFVQYESLVEFLREHCAVLQSIAPIPMPTPAPVERQAQKYASSYAVAAESSGCYFCKTLQQHNVFQCSEIKRMTCADRVAVARRSLLCFNCLHPGHFADACTRGFCTTCKRKHHTLLHEHFAPRPNSPNFAAADASNTSRSPIMNTSTMQFQQIEPQANNCHTPTQSTHSTTAQTSQSGSSATTDHTAVCNFSSTITRHTAGVQHEVLLSTAVVRIRNSRGHMLFARALMDSGSQRNLMTKEFAKKLKCKLEPDYLRVKGIGIAQTTSTFTVTTTVCSRSSTISEFAELMRFHVLPEGTANLPFNNVDIEQLLIPQEVKLADPNFYSPGPVDVIIGAEQYYDLLADGKIKLGEAGPTMQSSVFGWIVSGVVAAKLPQASTNPNSVARYRRFAQDRRRANSDRRETRFIANPKLSPKKCFVKKTADLEKKEEVFEMPKLKPLKSTVIDGVVPVGGRPSRYANLTMQARPGALEHFKSRKVKNKGQNNIFSTTQGN